MSKFRKFRAMEAKPIGTIAPEETKRRVPSSELKSEDEKWDFAVEEFSEGTLKAEYVNGEEVVDVTSGGEIPDGSTLKIYAPEINEGYELVSVMLNDEEITGSFVEGVYTVVVKKDLKLVVNAKLKDKVFKFTVAEVEGASIDVQMFVNGDLAPLPEDGSVKNGTMVNTVTGALPKEELRRRIQSVL